VLNNLFTTQSEILTKLVVTFDEFLRDQKDLSNDINDILMTVNLKNERGKFHDSENNA
jgi:hypothetical protein